MSEDGAKSFYDGLVNSGLIIPTGIPGAFGRGAVFEDVINRLDAFIEKAWSADGAEVRTYPPILDKQVIERTEYMDSFPQLLGAVFSFTGKELQAKEISEKILAGKPWEDMLKTTDLTLVPAACYPVYPSLAGKNPPGGRLITLLGWVFRREPSPEPTRMQAFRVRELIRTGTPDEVVEWRDMWHDRSLQLLKDLGLPAESEVATDPFFGRGGRMMAIQQKEQKLKFEIVVPVNSVESPTAVCSFNYHQDHFSRPFDIRTQEGELAHTACLGFGMERVVMGLFKTHGFDPKSWPAPVREKLWP